MSCTANDDVKQALSSAPDIAPKPLGEAEPPSRRAVTVGEPIFAPLPTVAGGWACVACDAPLHFATWSPKGQGRAPSRHYGSHSPEMIMTLPLQTVLADDAWLWLWWPDPHLPRLIEAMRALGFKFSGKGFTWIKTLKSLAHGSRWISSDEIESELHMGGGLTTRKNSETCWLGRRGKPKILSKGVREVIVAPVRVRSRKPDAFYERVERFCPGPGLDLFGRQGRQGWTVYGDEASKFDRDSELPAFLRRAAR
jgi:N6-adenosine-specific RNA methylase IME4